MLTIRSKPCLRELFASYALSRDSQRALQAYLLPGQTTIVQPRTSPMHFSTTSKLTKKAHQRKHESHSTHVEDNKNIESHTYRTEALFSEDGLSEEQRVILDLVLKQRKSVFFTGPAGTGKSVLLERIVKGLKKTYPVDDGSVAVTASTGLAAYNIGGTTLHRFAGIGIGKAPIEKLIDDILKNNLLRKRWINVEVLVIDEISMIDPTLFDNLDLIARKVRKVEMPFGGIQLVISGDFFQLPPVLEGPDDGSSRFCFEAKAWKSAIQNSVCLTKIYRQKDPALTSMLNEVREGIPSQATIAAFKNLSRPISPGTMNMIETTELFPLRREADQANSKRMRRLKDKVKTYYAIDGGMITNPATRSRLLNGCIAPEKVKMKKNAQVMLIKNIDETLVNGSQGLVVGFANKNTFLHGEWDEVDDGTNSKCVRSQRLNRHPEHHLPLYPVVRFVLKNDDTRIELCKPVEWAVERWLPDPEEKDSWIVEKLATRMQVPLILSWALSIHKAQGQTLDRVKVDINHVFETGQAYVALSRATSIDGLQVLNFDQSKITVHPKVRAYYANLPKKSIVGE